MDKKLFKLELIGFVFTSVLGTLCHFFYDWSNSNNLIGLFCPVNESPWEHLKLIWFPFVLWSIIEYFIVSKPKNYWFAKAVGGLSGMLIILAIFYTAYGITGKSSMFVDLTSYFVGVAAAFFIDYILIKSGKIKSNVSKGIFIALIIAVSIMFFTFTYAPPLIPLFRDPQNYTYGI